MAEPRVFLRQKWSRYLGELRPIHDIYVGNEIFPSPTPSVTPPVTPTSTPSVTPSNSPTPSITPSITPNPICPEEFVVTNSTSGFFDNGTYIRQYSASGQTMQYGYLFWTGTTRYVVLGTAPDGNNYAIFEYFDGGDYNTVFARFGNALGGNAFNTWTVLEQNPSILTSGATVVGGSWPLGTGSTIFSGVRYPSAGQKTVGYITYPLVCPTTTPTPSNTSTPSLTPTNTTTPSVTPTNTPTPSNTPTNTLTPTRTPTLTPTNTPSATISNCNYLYFSAGTGWISGISGCPASGSSYSLSGTEFVGYYYLSDDGVGQEKYIDGLGTGATTTCNSLSGTNYSMWIKYPMNSSGITMAIAAVTHSGVQPARNKDFRFIFYSGGTYIGNCGTSGNCLGTGFFLNTGTTENGLLYPATSGFLSSDGLSLPFTIDYFCVTPTPTPTVSVTQTNTPSVSPTNTRTPQVSPTSTPTMTNTQTSTPTNTPSITPSTSPPSCSVNMTVDNNTTGGGIDITGIEINGTPVTYVSGDNFSVLPGELGTFSTSITGVSVTMVVFYDASNANHAINVTDCDVNSFCCDNLTNGVGSCTFEGLTIDCTCTNGIQIIANNGDCL